MRETAEQLPLQHEQFDTRTRHWNDTVTWLAETLHGSMRTNFDYHFDGQELYAEDGGAMGEVFNEAIIAAQEIAQRNPSLLFELRRRLTEADEYQDMLAMMKGELPNTMITVSDFPPELVGAKADVGGYNVTRKQTMLRIISHQPDGTLRMTSQSLDGSNRQALEAIYHRLGVQPREGELLGQRMYRDLPEEWQEALADNLVDVHDQSLHDQFDGAWHAGIRLTPERRLINTAEFVRSQLDLLEWFVGEKQANSKSAERLRYPLAATMKARFDVFHRFGRENTNVGSGDWSAPSIERLYHEIERATQHAVRRGESFSGCGISAKMEGLSDITDQLNDAGFGNKTEEDEYGALEFKCRKGHSNTRPRGKLISHCQVCKDSVKC